MIYNDILYRKLPFLVSKITPIPFEIQWPARAVPIDPSPQALPDSQFVMLSVPIMLNQPSNSKLIMTESMVIDKVGQRAEPSNKISAQQPDGGRGMAKRSCAERLTR